MSKVCIFLIKLNRLLVASGDWSAQVGFWDLLHWWI